MAQKIAIAAGFCFLGFVICFLVWHLAVAKMEVKRLNIDIDFYKAKVEKQEEALKEYINVLAYLQGILRQGIVVQEDMQVPLRKGTIIIPPEAIRVPEEKNKSEE